MDTTNRRRVIMRALLLSIILILFASCSPRARFTHLIEKFPHLLTTDTITQIDTVKVEVPRVVHDTIINEHFFHEVSRDTLILEKERLTIKIFHDTIRNNVFIQGKCDTITVEKIIERKIPVKYYELKPWYTKVLNYLVIFLLTLLVVYITYRIIRKYLK